MLVGAMRLDVPESASLDWSFAAGVGDRPYLEYWVRVRHAQTCMAPIFMFIGGVSIAHVYYRARGFLAQEAGIVIRLRAGSTPGAGAPGAAPDPYPFALALFLGLLFIVITLRLAVFP